MASSSPLEILQPGHLARRVTLSALGYGRILICSAEDVDLSSNGDGVQRTPFGIIFDTNCLVNVRNGYTALVASAAGSYVQVHANVVWGQSVQLLLNIAVTAQTALSPRVYRQQPLAVLSLMESEERPNMPILGPVMELVSEDDGSSSSGAAAALVPETPPPEEAVASPEPEADDVVVPSSDADEEEEAALAAADAEEDEDESENDLWSADDSSQEDDDDDEEDTESDGGAAAADDGLGGGDPLCGSAGNMGVRHRAGLFKFVLSAGDDDVAFPPNRGVPIRRLLREVELQLNDDARMVGWQSSVDCACCPLDCTFYKAHWERAGEVVVVTMAIASHMFSNMPVREMSESVRLVMEHRARLIWGGPINVTVEIL